VVHRNNLPIIPVVVPAYNHADKVLFELGLTQAYSLLGAIIVDDCLIDDTAKVVNSCTGCHPLN